MTYPKKSTACGLCGAALALITIGCSSSGRETNVVKTPLPPRPPAVAPLEFILATPRDRLTPKADRDGVPDAMVRLSAIDDIPADAPMVKAAEQAAPVREKLGARYFFIDAEPIKRHDPFCHKSKSSTPQGEPPTPQPTTRITYFSYSRNAPVIVCMRGEEFVSLPPVPEGYQPPESSGEIEEATRLARQDERIRDKVRDLEAHAILADPEWRFWWWNAEGYGHRVFYVTFSEERSGDPQYYAVVDLTEENDKDKVRQAGEEPSR